MQADSINSSKLQLTPASKLKASTEDCAQYKQEIFYDGERLTLSSPPFYTNSLMIVKNEKRRYLILSIVPWLRQQFNILDTYVKDKVELPEDLAKSCQLPTSDYHKPLWSGSDMHITVSKWCKILQHSDVGHGEYMEVGEDVKLGSGMYIINIEIPYVYIGKHKSDDKLFSLSLRISQILYQPTIISEPKAKKTICRKRKSRPKEDGATLHA